MALSSHQLCFWIVIIGVAFCTYKTSATKLSHKHYPTIYVDQSGQGNYKTIQEAIDSVPNNNKNWISIKIKAGTYREQVKIPRDKPYIYLKGEARNRTNVVWDGHTDIDFATIICEADNVLIKCMTFINSDNFPPEKTENRREPAVAAKFSGDKIAVYRCGFRGLQDTIWDSEGRHYFKKCTITGAVDFIFGNGQSIYEECTLSVDRGVEKKMIGYITSQGRDKSSDNSGFVFIKCYVNGNGKAYLGRPWGSYSRVIFFKTYMEDIIVPQGWWSDDKYLSNGDENKLTYVENKCKGPGSKKSKRVSWLKELTKEDLKYFTSISYIDSDGWLRKLPSSKMFDN